jgi:hypothetical protein
MKSIIKFFTEKCFNRLDVLVIIIASTVYYNTNNNLFFLFIIIFLGILISIVLEELDKFFNKRDKN